MPVITGEISPFDFIEILPIFRKKAAMCRAGKALGAVEDLIKGLYMLIRANKT